MIDGISLSKQDFKFNGIEHFSIFYSQLMKEKTAYLDAKEFEWSYNGIYNYNGRFGFSFNDTIIHLLFSVFYCTIFSKLPDLVCLITNESKQPREFWRKFNKTEFYVPIKHYFL